MLVIGLTGGIGTGKSTVTAKFESRGVPVVDADRISHEQVEPGSPSLEKIRQVFGAEIIDYDGSLNRAELRKRVFNSPEERDKLEAILHPAIRIEIAARMAVLSSGYCILSVPLLIESGFTDMVNRILVIDTSHKTQLSRTMQRDGISEDETLKILNTQSSRKNRLKWADDLIDNNGGELDLDVQIEKLHKKYLSIAADGI